jgi:hypothetical protein
MQRFQLLVYPDTSEHYQYIHRRANVVAMAGAQVVFERIVGIDADFPLLLKFTPEAQEMFREWLSILGHRVRGNEMPGIMQTHLATGRELLYFYCSWLRGIVGQKRQGSGNRD